MYICALYLNVGFFLDSTEPIATTSDESTSSNETPGTNSAASGGLSPGGIAAVVFCGLLFLTCVGLTFALIIICWKYKSLAMKIRPDVDTSMRPLNEPDSAVPKK